MSLINTFAFTKTVVDGEKLLKATRNQYRLVAQRPYQSKKTPEDKGVALTLQVIADDMNYGVDKKTGQPRETNLFETFDVTVLSGQNHIPAKKGDYVTLSGFIPEKSFAIGFDLILRFRKVEKLNVKTK
ncbi:hypothetical protein NX781_07080 [Lactobacillus kullabergensis]|uniref:hypothetical protein n=1 Tax=Lactobacillus TaxID=1578 RepID=UPI002245AC6B|nr:hypothetical protein [Lactobacillus kullabergensis]MCT6888425.1 hypothetical protein [Lactobacillus sp.]MCX0291554.1 hypothetical protein [Lactobacillus kullabergensis]